VLFLGKRLLDVLPFYLFYSSMMMMCSTEEAFSPNLIAKQDFTAIAIFFYLRSHWISFFYLEAAQFDVYITISQF
jgi:hypothetical protein